MLHSIFFRHSLSAQTNLTINSGQSPNDYDLFDYSSDANGDFSNNSFYQSGGYFYLYVAGDVQLGGTVSVSPTNGGLFSFVGTDAAGPINFSGYNPLGPTSITDSGTISGFSIYDAGGYSTVTEIFT